VRDEDLEAVGAQRGGALVDERALVRGEERTGEVDLQAPTLQIHNLLSSKLQQSQYGLEPLVPVSRG
jgi:hypothetical protein